MASRTCKVLIVEDFPPDRELYRRCLLADSSCTYQLLEANSAAAGLELCRTEAIDAILLDYVLPDADGLQFLKALHAQGNGDRPPVVMVTGEGDEKIAVQAIKLGAEDYLVKRRLTPELLQMTVQGTIANARLRLQLRQSETRFRVSIENMLDCFGICSAIRDESEQITDFRIDYLNAAALESNQMTPADIGRSLCEVFPAHRETGLFEEYCRVVETGEPFIKENLIYSDVFGTRQLTRAYDVQVSKLNDGFVVSWRDVTVRKQAELDRQRTEAALRASEQRFRSIFNTTYQFLGLLSPEGILLEVNQTALDFGGITREEAIGRPFWEVRWWTISLQTQQQLQAAIRRASQGEFVRYEVEVLGAGDTTTTIDFSLKPMHDESGQIVLVIPEGRDIGDRLWSEGDRRRMEEILRQNEERLSLAIEGAGMATWDFDLQTGRAILSKEHFRMLGYEPNPTGEATMETWQSRVHPDDLNRVLQALEQTRQTRSLYNPEYRIIRADNGEIRWLQVFGRFLYTETGEATRFVGVFFDTSDRKASEVEIQRLNRELARRVDELQTILDALPVGIAIAEDPECKVIRVSRFAQAMLSVPSEMNVSATGDQAEQRPFRETRNGKAIPGEELPMQVAAAQGIEVRDVEFQMVRSDGATFDWWVNAVPLFDEQGAVRGCVGVFMDITKGKQVEEALRQSEERYRFLAGLIPQLVWIADSAGMMLDVNDRWLAFTGLTLEQVQTEGWEAIVHPEDTPILGKAWELAQQTGTHYQAEGRIRRADGMYRWHLHQAMPLKDAQEHILKWFGTATDIHDLKLIEADRAQLLAESQAARAEAEAANRSKDEFVAMVAHELRSPLNAILGWAKLLQTRTLDPATTAKALETIVRNTQAQVQLVEDLLDVSRMVRGTLQLTMAPVDLVKVIEAALDVVHPMAVAKQLDLRFTILDFGLAVGQAVEQLLDSQPLCKPKSQLQNPKLQISGDFNRLQQIVVNLLTNAVKFTPTQGRVEVKLSFIPAPSSLVEGKEVITNDKELITKEPMTNYAQITVSDTGKGIAAEWLPVIFDRFQQGQKNIGSKDGLGLGLAIVRHLVELHNGTITAESQGIGQGATFTVRLPVLSAIVQNNSDGSPGFSDATSLAGIRVLAVDDEPDMLDLITFVLEESGAEVKFVTTAVDALECLLQFKPDILVSDIAMPGSSGYELVQQMRSIHPEGQIPAISLTAYASATYEERSLQAGFQQHLTKPVNPEILVAAIVSLVRGGNNSCR
jgi:PAS domain S-box-containing protein